MVAEAPPRLLRAGPKEFDIRLKATIRTLYLVQGCQPSEIEKMGLGLDANQVSKLANREGWTAQRRRALRKAEESATASADLAVAKVAEAIAIESEELCFKALTQTRAGLDKGGLDGAKQAQAASSTLRNLAGVAKQLRDPGSSSDAPQSVAFNLFFAGRAEKAEPKTVEPIEVKQVTE